MTDIIRPHGPRKPPSHQVHAARPDALIELVAFHLRGISAGLALSVASSNREIYHDEELFTYTSIGAFAARRASLRARGKRVNPVSSP